MFKDNRFGADPTPCTCSFVVHADVARHYLFPLLLYLPCSLQWIIYIGWERDFVFEYLLLSVFPRICFFLLVNFSAGII